MINPEKLKINEAWILFELNEDPIIIEPDTECSIIAMIEAVSGFIFGTEMTNAPELSQMASKKMLRDAYNQKTEYAKTLYIPSHLSANHMSKEAEELGISVIRVSEKDLSLCIEDARQGFREYAY